MFPVRAGLTFAFIAAVIVGTFSIAGSCSSAPNPQPESQSATTASSAAASQSNSTLELPINFERRLGDLDAMAKQHEIRVLVVPSHSGFFYDKGHPEGIFYESFNEFQHFANQKIKSGGLRINVTFIPLRPEQLHRALAEGIGDIIGYPVIVTPEREKEVLFTAAIYSDVKQVIVSGPKAAPLSSLDDLSGKEVYVNPLTAYYETLQHLNESLQKANKAPIRIKSADPNLTDEDLLEMVNAGLIPATVTINVRAEFWSKILPHLTRHPGITLKEDGHLSWATRNDSPKLRQLLNDFIKDHQAGTSFGNTLLRRYLQNTKWVKGATSTEDMRKFDEYVRFFRKYAAEYNFDYLMLMAQGYQESGLDQSLRNPSGAVGIMQVIPKFAGAPPISVTDVSVAENNIHAGAKMMRNIADTYFNDDKLDSLNKTLMVFASYNAGPNRISRLRKIAASQGLNPNKWFGNVELVVAREVGQQTVQYVSNIFKYYVAYKLTLEEANSAAPRP